MWSTFILAFTSIVCLEKAVENVISIIQPYARFSSVSITYHGLEHATYTE